MIPETASTLEPTSVGAGRWAVPGNRWDLLDGIDSRSEPPEISVVIPYFENQHDLDLLLTALRGQTHPTSRLQVVIADDGSVEPPRTDALGAAVEVSVVRQADRGFRAAAARNLGFHRAEGSVVLFLDGDTVPEPEYAARLARLPDLIPDAVVSGRRRYADLSAVTPAGLAKWLGSGPNPPDEWAEPTWLSNHYQRTGNLLSVDPRSYKYLIGAVLGCSAEMFGELGGFDDSIVGYGGEDYDFTYRAFTAGGVLAHVPSAVAWHDGRDWAGRTAPQERTPRKNREVMMLAERIPEPSMRGTGQLYGIPDGVVTIDASNWSLGAGVLCLRSLLTVLDCRVCVVGRDQTSRRLRRAFDQDPRVSDRGPESDRFRRERWYLDVSRPVVATSIFADHLAAQWEADVGSLAVCAGGDLIVAAESARYHWRSQRHRSLPAALRDQWFARCRYDLDECGLRLIADEPALDAEFGGY
ncbi:Glycosyltransferase like family 2 [Nakamurella panacisegetis]|uniref:Glycosyltransferase like family 2 n=1 Tax=Nakamurella panacisegetis TaxID=1090615 RepID=A0A1H0SAS7_9ACTN|nr:glycosyltransferase [Nakamurella panacisegetis]SDP38840.1 Glycosyltransferase like family 2 [Nakamurella panacisegetis]